MGSLLGLLAALLGILSSTAEPGLGMNPYVAILIVLACGALVGLGAGCLVVVGKVPSIIATLGLLIALDGMQDWVIGGGDSIYGGRGNILGTLLGVLLIHETRQFVDWHWQRSELTLMAIGALLILSVLGHRVLFPKQGKTGHA